LKHLAVRLTTELDLIRFAQEHELLPTGHGIDRTWRDPEKKTNHSQSKGSYSDIFFHHVAPLNKTFCATQASQSHVRPKIILSRKRIEFITSFIEIDSSDLGPTQMTLFIEVMMNRKTDFKIKSGMEGNVDWIFQSIVLELLV
jgi:hypothetical protein